MLEQLLSIEDVLERDERYVGTTSGSSMWPLLRDRRDTIVVERPCAPLKRFDIALYRRGDRYVLHRVVDVQAGSYTMLGDNCANKEFGVPSDAVIGVLTELYRGEHHLDARDWRQRLYARVWYALYPVRHLIKRVHPRLARVRSRAVRRTVSAVHSNTVSSDADRTERSNLPRADFAQAAHYLIYLLGCALRGHVPRPIPEDENFTWPDVYRLACHNSVQGASWPAVTLVSSVPQDIRAAWERDANVTLLRQLQFEVEREQVFSDMRAAGLAYLPFKGIRLAECYPRPGMRAMADCDFLYGAVEACKAGGFCVHEGSEKTSLSALVHMMRARGYRVESVRSGNHESFHKPPCFNFEPHRRLVAPSNRFSAYYANPWKRARQNEKDSFCYTFSWEDEYVYLLVHALKHLESAGFGVRFMLDVRALLDARGSSLDWAYLHAQFEELGIVEFEGRVRKLADTALTGSLPSSVALDADLEALLLHAVSCGAYGSQNIQVEQEYRAHLERAGGDVRTARCRYLAARLFDAEALRDRYPRLARVAFLRPALHVTRWSRAFCRNPRKLLSELRCLFHLS